MREKFDQSELKGKAASFALSETRIENTAILQDSHKICSAVHLPSYVCTNAYNRVKFAIKCMYC